MRPTLELLGDLAEQTRSFVQIELSLVRAELRERGAILISRHPATNLRTISTSDELTRLGLQCGKPADAVRRLV